jgi:hypothetical protein
MTCLAQLLTVSNNYGIYIYVIQCNIINGRAYLLSIKEYIIMIMKDEDKIIQNMADEPSGEGIQGMTKTDVTPLKNCHSCLTMFLLLTVGD